MLVWLSDPGFDVVGLLDDPCGSYANDCIVVAKGIFPVALNMRRWLARTEPTTNICAIASWG